MSRVKLLSAAVALLVLLPPLPRDSQALAAATPALLSAPPFVSSFVRSVGQTHAPVPPAMVVEDGLADLKSDGSGGLLLTRGLDRLGHSWDESIPRASTYWSSDGGVRWQPRDIPALTPWYDRTRTWEGVSPAGTLITAEHIVWGSTPDYDWYERRLLSHRSTDGGKTWTEGGVIGAIRCGDCDDYRFQGLTLMAGANGAWMAVWQSTDAHRIQPWVGIRSCEVTLHAAFSADDGISWTSAGEVWHASVEKEECEGGDYVRQIVAGAGPVPGGWGLIWRSECQGEILAARSDGNGPPWTVGQLRAPIGECSGSPIAADASTVATGDGAWIVAWAERPPEGYHRIQFVRSTDGGASWSAPSGWNGLDTLESLTDVLPSLAADGEGRVLAAWTSYVRFEGEAEYNADILARTSTDGGLTWSQAALVDPAAEGDTAEDLWPLAAATGNGRWAVAWTSREPGDGSWLATPVVKVAVLGATCGNGELDPAEECDDGNSQDLDGCNSNCSLPGCGNERLEPGEVCEITGDDRACNESCTSSGCGDGTRNPFAEECDDGNTSDQDTCLSNCQAARCGDGLVIAGLEECDDANTSDTDGCLPSCRLARCGDGVVFEGDEACDDGEPWGGDACTDRCEVARCGDGRVWLGVELCDDPTGAQLDGNCSPDCAFVHDPCGDADANGVVTTSDALRILRRAVGLAGDCAPDRCDVSGGGGITVNDAAKALRIAAGSNLALRCPFATVVRLVVNDGGPFGMLQFEADFTKSGFEFLVSDRGRVVDCESSLFSANVWATSSTPGVLEFAVLAVDGVAAPVDLVVCNAYVRRDTPVGGGPVPITISVWADPMGDWTPWPSRILLLSD